MGRLGCLRGTMADKLYLSRRGHIRRRIRSLPIRGPRDLNEVRPRQSLELTPCA